MACLICQDDITDLFNQQLSLCCLQPVCRHCYQDWLRFHDDQPLVCHNCAGEMFFSCSQLGNSQVISAVVNLAGDFLQTLIQHGQQLDKLWASLSQERNLLVVDLHDLDVKLTALRDEAKITAQTYRLLRNYLISHESAWHKTYHWVEETLTSQIQCSSKRIAWLKVWLASDHGDTTNDCATVIVVLDRWRPTQEVQVSPYCRHYWWRHPTSDIFSSLQPTQGWQLLPRGQIKALPLTQTETKSIQPDRVKVVTISDGSDVILVNSGSDRPNRMARIFFGWEAAQVAHYGTVGTGSVALGLADSVQSVDCGQSTNPNQPKPTARPHDCVKIPTVLWWAAYQYGIVCLHNGAPPTSLFSASGGLAGYKPANATKATNYYAVYELFDRTMAPQPLRLVAYIDQCQYSASFRLVYKNALYHFGGQISLIDLLPKTTVTPLNSAAATFLQAKVLAAQGSAPVRLTITAILPNKVKVASLIEHDNNLVYLRSNDNYTLLTFDLDTRTWSEPGPEARARFRQYHLPGAFIVENDSSFVAAHGSVVSAQPDLGGNLYTWR